MYVLQFNERWLNYININGTYELNTNLTIKLLKTIGFVLVT